MNDRKIANLFSTLFYFCNFLSLLLYFIQNLASSQEILDEFLAKEALKPKKTRKSTGFWAYAVEGDDSFVQPIHEVIPTPQVVSKRRVPMVLEELFGDDVEAVVAEEEEVEVPVVKPKSTTSKRPRVEDTPSPLVVDVQLLPIASDSTSIQDRPLPTKEIETSVTDFSTYSTKQLLAHHNESQTELSPEPFGPKPSARKKPRSNSKTLTSLQSSSIASTSKIIATPKKARVEEAVIIFVEYSSKKGSGKGKKAISWSLKGKENEVLAENVSVSEKVVEIVEKPVNDVPKSYSSDNSLSLDIRTDTGTFSLPLSSHRELTITLYSSRIRSSSNNIYSFELSCCRYFFISSLRFSINARKEIKRSSRESKVLRKCQVCSSESCRTRSSYEKR